MPTVFRHEYKYLCDPGQLLIERKRLQAVLRRDPHAGADGSYLIRSVYFDDPENSCYFENEDGTDPRAKYRIRIYNCEDARISLERKAKLRGMTHKDTVPISRGEAETLLSGRVPRPEASQPPLLRRMYADLEQRVMTPAVIVQYRRVPFLLPMGNVRVTLDQQIASSQAVGRFFEPQIPLRQILAGGQGILEVKWDSLLPDWLYRMLQLSELQWNSFSKYYLCRRFNTYGGTIL